MTEAPIYPPTPYVNHLTFRNSKIIYYGPHACENCGIFICKMGHEFGGNAFTYPDGPIYPNTEWHPHVCNPKRVEKYPKVQSSQNGSGVVLTVTAPPDPIDGQPHPLRKP